MGPNLSPTYFTPNGAKAKVESILWIRPTTAFGAFTNVQVVKADCGHPSQLASPAASSARRCAPERNCCLLWSPCT